MVAALDKKLLRDLRHLKGQLVTIALVVACGIASFVGVFGTVQSIESARDAFYARYRFADVFARLERAPQALEDDIEALPGVAAVTTRIVRPVMLPLPWMSEPVVGVLTSLPDAGAPGSNDVFLKRGRLPDPEHFDEVVVLDSFAEAHELKLGGTLPVVIGRRERALRVVGVVLAPEHVFPISQQTFTADPKRLAVLWMRESAMAPAFQMEGAFNDVVVRLQPGASVEQASAGLDRVLEPYGGAGAHGRSMQLSHRFLTGEVRQLHAYARVVPMIFLGVAAFILNVVLSRLITLQRPEIATLKAVGYRRWEIAGHYFKLVALIVLIGAALGVAGGFWVGEAFLGLYRPFFRFPALLFRPDPALAVISVVVSVAAAAVGAFAALRAVMRLPAAEAMRPPAPARYHRSALEAFGLHNLLGPTGRLVVREVSRRPLRLGLSALGIGMAIAIFIIGRFGGDSMSTFVDLQFGSAYRQDVGVGFVDAVPPGELDVLRAMPGVRLVESSRSTAAKLRHGLHERDALLIGHHPEATLARIVEYPVRFVPPPRDGVVMTRKLAELLDAGIGDEVDLEVLEGEHVRGDVRIVGLVDDPVGLQVHMSIDGLHRLLGEEVRVNSAQLTVDPELEAEVVTRFKEVPAVGSVLRLSSMRAQFEQQTAETMRTLAIILTLFAAIIAIGVVYNNARVSLSLRSRELASLRVLGFTRAEISTVLLGELAVQVLVALPVGMTLGVLGAKAVFMTIDPELYRMPSVVSPRTHALAVVVVLVASAASALFVRRHLDRLDLIGVLKSRE